ncbi:hypothetical protein BDZ89DRAFT_722632 [Hymenopellis radicata]|nr:hypothetical protein BDZ89DRAFT_722632 [Hymenopellis radicata]
MTGRCRVCRPCMRRIRQMWLDSWAGGWDTLIGPRRPGVLMSLLKDEAPDALITTRRTDSSTVFQLFRDFVLTLLCLLPLYVDSYSTMYGTVSFRRCVPTVNLQLCMV